MPNILGGHIHRRGKEGGRRNYDPDCHIWCRPLGKIITRIEGPLNTPAAKFPSCLFEFSCIKNVASCLLSPTQKAILVKRGTKNWNFILAVCFYLHSPQTIQVEQRQNIPHVPTWNPWDRRPISRVLPLWWPPPCPGAAPQPGLYRILFYLLLLAPLLLYRLVHLLFSVSLAQRPTPFTSSGCPSRLCKASSLTL